MNNGSFDFAHHVACDCAGCRARRTHGLLASNPKPQRVGIHFGQLVYVTGDGDLLPVDPDCDQFVEMVEEGLAPPKVSDE